jgi:peptidoglycan/xylan/chitin deacetylase (PgdA/CDA1 family)
MDRNLFKRLVMVTVSALYHVCANTIRILRPRRRKGAGVILYYHGVSAEQRRSFMRQIQWLANNRSIVPLADIKSRAAQRSGICSLTFDDAFQNVLLNAVPVLEEARVPAVVFAVAGCLGRTPTWSIPSTDPDAELKVMSADELASLPWPLIEVGSHTYTHRPLAKLPSPQVHEELERSRQCLEEITRRPVRFLSAPYGSVHPQLPTFAEAAGYSLVVTSSPQPVTSESDIFNLGRIAVSADDWSLEFKLKALGAYAWRRWLGRHRASARRIHCRPENGPAVRVIPMRTEAL